MCRKLGPNALLYLPCFLLYIHKHTGKAKENSQTTHHLSTFPFLCMTWEREPPPTQCHRDTHRPHTHCHRKQAWTNNFAGQATNVWQHPSQCYLHHRSVLVFHFKSGQLRAVLSLLWGGHALRGPCAGYNACKRTERVKQACASLEQQTQFKLLYHQNAYVHLMRATRWESEPERALSL